MARCGSSRLVAKLSGASRVGAAALCCAALLLIGCRQARSPETVAGVRALYRSIGIAASSGNFVEICQADIDARLRSELEPLRKYCFTRTFERWAEKVRLSKIKTGTRIVLSGHEARIYDGAQPEKALYNDGEWRLDEAPEIAPSRRSGR